MMVFEKMAAFVATTIFIVIWLIGVMASVSVTIILAAGLFSIIQIVLGVESDSTLIYGLFSVLGLV